MLLITAKNNRFETALPAKSSVLKVLNNKGVSVLDELKLTGRKTDVMVNGECCSMVEVEHSFGVDEVNEDFLWQ